MSEGSDASPMSFEHAVDGLMAGDFSRLAPLCRQTTDGAPSIVLRWFDEGRFADSPEALKEAFSCACFNGCTDLVVQFLNRRVDPRGGDNMGLNAFHWAANRGHLPVVELLILANAPLETRNAYGGTVLGCAVWSAVHEPRRDHIRIIEALLKAGANVAAADYPSGNDQVDALLEQYGATAQGS